MMPGQFGPISRDFFPRMSAFTRIMSLTGIPSVVQTTSSTSASTASRTESAAAGAGTKTIEALQPVFCRASHTVSNTGTFSSNIWPPFPGVTPATTFVPYSMHDQTRAFIDEHRHISGTQEKEKNNLLLSCVLWKFFDSSFRLALVNNKF